MLIYIDFLLKLNLLRDVKNVVPLYSFFKISNVFSLRETHLLNEDVFRKVFKVAKPISFSMRSQYFPAVKIYSLIFDGKLVYNLTHGFQSRNVVLSKWPNTEQQMILNSRGVGEKLRMKQS